MIWICPFNVYIFKMNKKVIRNSFMATKLDLAQVQYQILYFPLEPIFKCFYKELLVGFLNFKKIRHYIPLKQLH